DYYCYSGDDNRVF
nr:immunoglobulin light chain junction region [Macaca mulatta]MOW59299.1 immunoglobulin light chain junction region [Macaca mulatta]MOW59361.1 immunoglobulin light chain junction region [Macaca mulatta]MOW61078.1 immunoglobulin light chain junction region [Macaca mulatta]MOW61347.1 immunoglobulin light chain junction region [Macaca mulatta]